MMRFRSRTWIKQQYLPHLVGKAASETLRAGHSGNPDANTGKCIREAHLTYRARVPDYRYELKVVLDHDLYGCGDLIVEMHGRFQGQFPGKGKKDLSDTVHCSWVHT